LTVVNKNGVVSETYAYDANGNRTSKKLDTNDAGVLTTYYYDGSGILIALECNGNRYYVSIDQVGSPKVVTDSAGAVIKKLDYDRCLEIRRNNRSGW